MILRDADDAADWLRRFVLAPPDGQRLLRVEPPNPPR